MSRLRHLGRELRDFLVGDDWRLAAGTAVALGIVALLAGARLAAWWVLPVVIPIGLLLSLRGRGSPPRR